MRIWIVLIGLLIAGSRAGPASAEVWPPCDGCAIALPDHPSGPLPLLVVLHGDHGTATEWVARWREPALDRGWAVLALQCPVDRGCEEGVWYRWDGDAQWVLDQIDALAGSVEIDRSQIFLAGWSGGATYLGMHLKSWRDFAGLVMHGGGVGPRDGQCARLPVYFLVGDENRYHSSTKLFRRFLSSCRAKVRWDLMKGADHTAEERALTGEKAVQILDWLTRQAGA